MYLEKFSNGIMKKLNAKGWITTGQRLAKQALFPAFIFTIKE